MGPDNPFFDLRQPGDPGGVGYYRVHTQVQLFDSPNTGYAVSCQAVKPAGRDNDGLEDGPTVVSPGGVAVPLAGRRHGHPGLRRQERQPELELGGSAESVGAIRHGGAASHPADGAGRFGQLVRLRGGAGRYHYDAVAGPGTANGLEVLPGLHWQMAPNWWMSGGVVLPVNTAPSSVNQWQFTCSFQF